VLSLIYMSANPSIFHDRAHAGRDLAARLSSYAGAQDVLLFALPRGGVVVGAEVAKALSLPLDVIITRKFGAPFNPEFAIGAMAETGEAIWNDAERDKVDAEEVRTIVDQERAEAKRRIHVYRADHPLPDMTGKTAIIVDDGVATGLTIRAAIAAARHQHAQRIVIAVPHGAKETMDLLRNEVDEVVDLEEPVFYAAVGQYYQQFPETHDAEVVSLLTLHGAHS